jgi:hypothetical protein
MGEAKLELDLVSQLLIEWRAQKKTKFEHCPIDLIHRARALTVSFTVEEIMKATGLSERQVAPFGRKNAEKSLEIKKDFVEIPTISPSAAVNPSITVEIRDGLRLISVQMPATTDLSKNWSARTRIVNQKVKVILTHVVVTFYFATDQRKLGENRYAICLRE